MQVSVCLGVILIPEYLDFHSGYSAPCSRLRLGKNHNKVSSMGAPKSKRTTKKVPMKHDIEKGKSQTQSNP